jgi:PPE-repeat protein
MTAPIWMASPPEVHSGLLSSGPGSGSLLAAAGVWNSLSTEYASVAEELSTMLSAVQAGAWQGPSAESYVAANVPYLAWLMQASANSAAAAAQHASAAAAYSVALAAMPTLAELAANHAVHAVLVATNFFGINTIPVALNEADYVRMWSQAANTMAIYQTVSSAAVASTPQTGSAPQIQKTNSNSTNSRAGNQGNGGNQDSGRGPTHLSWYTTRLNEIMTAIEGDLSKSSSPSVAIYNLLHDPVLAEIPHWAGEIALTFGKPLTELAALSLGLIAPAVGSAPLAIAPVGAAGGFAGLAGLAGLAQPVFPAVAALPVTPAPTLAPAVGSALPSAVASGSAPASAPASAPGAASAGSPAPPSPPSPPPPITGAEGFGYSYLVGGFRVESESRTSASAGAEKKAPEPYIGAAAAAATPEQTRRHRRRREGLTDPRHRYEYLHPGSEVTASDQGARTMGFAGTAGKTGAGQTAGLTTLSGDSFGDGPAMPMLPSSWEPG